MIGICFRRENSGFLQDQWSFVFSNFGVTEIWERSGGSGDLEIYQPTVDIDTAIDLPAKRPMVVLAHQEGKYIQGVDSLVDFAHPEDAIYLFGGSRANLSDEEDLGGRAPDHLLYIPSVRYEMYGHAAGYITLYDRLVKRGSFG